MSAADAETIYATEVKEETKKRLEVSIQKLRDMDTANISNGGSPEQEEEERESPVHFETEEESMQVDVTAEGDERVNGEITLEPVNPEDYGDNDDPSTEEEFEPKIQSDDEDWNP